MKSLIEFLKTVGLTLYTAIVTTIGFFIALLVIPIIAVIYGVFIILFVIPISFIFSLVCKKIVINLDEETIKRYLEEKKSSSK